MAALSAGLLVVMVAVVGAQKAAKQSFFKKCTSNVPIGTIKGVAVKHQDDRKWAFTCSNTPIGDLNNNCKWEEEAPTDRDIPSLSLCQNQGFAAGVSRKLGTSDDDGQIMILCCISPIHFMHGCIFTPWTNEKTTETFIYRVPGGMALTGIISYYDFINRARRYRFEICKIGKFL